MPSYSALDAVSSAIYTTLNVASLLALAPGGVGDAIEQLTSYPNILYEVSERTLGGFGSRPGVGSRTLEVDLRLHVFSTYVGFYEAQQIMAKCIELLTTPLTATGYSVVPYPFHDETIPLAGQMVAGVVVNELVGNFRIYVTETP